jgi:hypothetical protein
MRETHTHTHTEREREREMKGPMPPLHELVPIYGGTFKIVYANNCHRLLV